MNNINLQPHRGWLAPVAKEQQRYQQRFCESTQKQVQDHVECALPQSLEQHLMDYCQRRGVNLDRVPEGLGSGRVDAAKLLEALQPTIQRLFASSLTSLNAQEYASVKNQTERFVELLCQAQQEQQLGRFEPADAYRLVNRNLALVSMQDQASNECLLGDHGIRHLLDHNITTCERLADQLEKQGVGLRAVDRLALHQSMLLHDLGYAIPSVRQSIALEGIKGQDAGHALMASHYARGCFDDPNDPLSKVFNEAQQVSICRCILYHDQDANGLPGLQIPKAGEEASPAILETLMRIADNSHAFDEKLPQLLYSHPAFLKTFRYIQSALELGDLVLVQKLKSQLQDEILNTPGLGADETGAYLKASQQVDARQVTYAAHRLFGDAPEFAFDGSRFHLKLKESPIHEALATTFGVPRGQQAEKLVSELAPPGSDSLGSGSPICIHLEMSQEMTPFQERVQSEVLHDRAFVNWSKLDRQLAQNSQSLQQALSHLCASKSEERNTLEAQLQQLRKLRKSALQAQSLTAPSPQITNGAHR